MLRDTGLLILLVVLGDARAISAHENTIIHPFALSSTGLVQTGAEYRSSAYRPLWYAFNESPIDAKGYDPEESFTTRMCKPGTRGTIEEDFFWLEYNPLPWLDHFWKPWDPGGGQHNAVAYAKSLFDQGVMHFAEGKEADAFYTFGRCTHVLEDMGSVPHVYDDYHPNVFRIDGNGYENWCFSNQGSLQLDTRAESVNSVVSAMESLGKETYRTARIAGRLNRDPQNPVDGDLGILFPGDGELRYISYHDSVVGHTEYWWLEGVGHSHPGQDPTESEFVPWGKVPSFAGEPGSYYYVQENQERVIPASVFGYYDSTPFHNWQGFSLAQLWAGVDGYRATPDQQHGLIPRTVEFTTGFMKYLWDFINPPPFLTEIRIEQDQNADGQIDSSSGEVALESRWVDHATPARTVFRKLETSSESPATRIPTRIELRFSEPVFVTSVSVGPEEPSLILATNVASTLGPTSTDYQDGVPRVVLENVDLSSLPDGQVRVFVQAQDLSNHVEPVASTIDPDPSTRAGRMPDGSWRNIETGAPFIATDTNHSFELAGFSLRAVPTLGKCTPGRQLTHVIEVRNLGVPLDTEATLSAGGSSPGWTSNVVELDGIRLRLPQPGADWTPTGAQLTVSCESSASPTFAASMTLSTDTHQSTAQVLDMTESFADSPTNDHPDDTRSVADPRYPTPWLQDPDAPIGVLLNGWGAGVGHLLGRYGIATALVTPTLQVAGANRDLNALDVLVVGSGGLVGLDRQPSFREKLERFVATGGALVAFTPQRGEELAALPGGQVAGYGWSEDQACFGAAARIVGEDASLAGQATATIDLGADGYLTRWPDDAAVLLRRTSNDQPAMIRYRYGRGVVYVLTTYPDWAYGTGQSSAAERALVRDVVTTALAHPADVPQYTAGETVSLDVTVENRSWAATSSISLEPFTPDRAALPPTVVARDLVPLDFASLQLELSAPGAPGVYPVGYRLLDGGERALHGDPTAAFFAVSGAAVPPQPAEPPFMIWITVPSDSVPVGGDAAATVHVRNNSDQDFAGAIAASWVHYVDGPLLWLPDVVVPARAEAALAFAYPVVDQVPFTVVYGLFDRVDASAGGFDERACIVKAYKGFTPFFPAASLTIETAVDVLYAGATLPATVALRSLSPGTLDTELRVRLRSGDNRTLWEERRTLALEAGAAIRSQFDVLAFEGDAGLTILEAELLHAGRIVARASRPLLPPALTATPSLPQPWTPEEPSVLLLTVRNDGFSALRPGALTATIDDGDGSTLWTGTATLAALSPGGEQLIALPITLPPLRFGNHYLRWTARVPEVVRSGTLLLRNEAELQVTAAPVSVAAGETLAARAEVLNRGDFVLSGELSIASPGIVARTVSALEVAPGETGRLDAGAVIGQEVSYGPHTVAAEFASTDILTAATDFLVPPPQLVFLDPPTSAAAGSLVTLTVVNVGGGLDTSVWTARLLPLAHGSGSTATPLAEAQRDLRLAPGESADLELRIPADLATGVCALAFAARDPVTGRSVSRRTHLLVSGLSASLEVATDRAVYPATDVVTALALLVNGDAPLDDATLRFAVAGGEVILPIAYEGTVFVSPSGSDAEGDGSRGAPFATPQRGIDAAAPGDRVLLLAGTYSGPVTLREGTILQGEVVGGALAAVIDGANVTGASGSCLDHVTVRDASVVFPPAVASVRVTDCTFLGGSRATPSRGQGIVFLGAADGVLVGRNRLSGYTLTDAGIQFYGPASDIVVHGNTLQGFTSTRGNAGVLFWNSARDVVVQGNRLLDLGGDGNGVHVWGGAADSADIRVLGNHLERVAGDCSGVQFWCEIEGARVDGNRLAQLAGACVGVHLWDKGADVSVADNTLDSIPADAGGIHLWEPAEPHIGVRIENNRLADLSPLDGRGGDNGIVVWGESVGLSISRNVLDRVDGDTTWDLGSGIAIAAAFPGLRVERNIVRGSPAGLSLRLPAPTPPAQEPLDAVLANNLFLGCEAGFLHENLPGNAGIEFRDDIIASSGRAGILAIGGSGPSAVLVHNTLFHDNAVNAEGLQDPLGRDGNIGGDPLFLDEGAGDFRPADDSPCLDAGSVPLLDIGPLDDDLRVLLGPRPVAPDPRAPVQWEAFIPVTAESEVSLEFQASIAPLPVGGSLLLSGVLTTSRGQVLASDTAAFTVQTDPVLLRITTPRAVYRPGETIPVSVEVSNTSGTPISGLAVLALQDGVEVASTTLDLAPGLFGALAFETAADADFGLHVTAGLAAADLAVPIALPEISMEIDAPEVVGDGPFAVAVVVRNDGRVPAALHLSAVGADDDFTLPPGSVRSFARTTSLLDDTVIVAEVTGDAAKTARRLVRFGPRISVALEVAPVQRATGATAALRLANAGSLAGAVALRVELTPGDGSPVASWDRALRLEPGAELRETLALGVLPPGGYVLRATGGPAPVSASFRVAPDCSARVAGIVAATALDGEGRLPVAVRILSEGAADFLAVLSLRTGFSSDVRELTLRPGEERATEFALPVAVAAPGDYTATVRLEACGTETEASVPVRLAPALALVAAPDLVLATPGTPTEVAASVVNTGLIASSARIRVRVGDLFEATQERSVGAGASTAVSFAVALPDDLPAGLDIPSRLVVSDATGGSVLTRDFTVRVVQLYDLFLRGELDQPTYADGAPARFILRVANRGTTLVPLRAVVGHGDQRVWMDVTVTPTPEHGESGIDFDGSAGELRLAHNVTAGVLTSAALDVGDAAGAELSWTAEVPEGCAVALETRTGPVPEPDGSWTAWSPIPPGGCVGERHHRFLQYQARMSSPAPGSTPVLHEVRVATAEPARAIVHTTTEDFQLSPQQLSFDFSVDFSTADSVFFGLHAPSGRSLVLDSLPIRRAGTHLQAWTDQGRYTCGDPVRLGVAVDAPGILSVTSPWETLWHTFDGAGTAALELAVPDEVASGTYLIAAEFLGERVTLPVEVDGYLVRVLEVALDRPAYSPGETVQGALLLLSDSGLDRITVDGHVSDGRQTLGAFSTGAALQRGVVAVPFDFPLGSLARGAAALSLAVCTGPEANPRALQLAAAEVRFDVLAPNQPPIANAGQDAVAVERSWAALDGGASFDTDGDPLRWRWTQAAGPGATLLGADTPRPVFLVPEVPRGGAELSFDLEVSDGATWSGADSVRVWVANANRAPVARTGGDVGVRVGETALLDASGSSDPDGDLLTFRWLVVARPEGSAAQLEGGTEPEAALRPDVPGDYEVSLVAADWLEESATTFATVSTVNSRPRADAGEDAAGRPGQPVQLDGSASDDADGDVLTYRWSLLEQPAGGDATIDDDAAVRPLLTPGTCGRHLVELRVSDGVLESAPDQVVVDCANLAPVADAGADRATRLGERVTLDGSGSSDADGDELSYRWALTSRPAGSEAALDDPEAPGPSFTADALGGYSLTLVVSDGIADSEPDGIGVSVGTDVAAATIELKPVLLRLAAPPALLRARIELPDGFSATEIAPASAAITAVGKRTLARPVRRVASRGAAIGDADRDGRPEMTLYYPVKPLLPYLKPGTAPKLTFRGPLATVGRFVGSAVLRVAR